MMIWNFLNSKRLRDYPRLILIASSSVILLNVLLKHGWIGGLTGILLWGDYICYYAAAVLYRINIAQLYDSTIQQNMQFSLISPTIPPGTTLYTYPPNAALFHSILSYIPLTFSLILWCGISIICVIVAAKLMHRFFVGENLSKNGLSSLQLSVIIFSSFAFIEGFNAGQMHSITLLLMVAIVIATMKEKWFLAGLLAAGLTFKPQFVIGFLIIWFIWKKYYAILVFILFTLIWNGIVLITKGITPYLDFIVYLKYMVYLPYIKEGIPHSILSTPYTFIASFLPFKYASLWNTIYYGIIVVLVALFAFLAFKLRKLPTSKQSILISLALLFPLIITPYALLHDLLVLFPIMILLAIDHETDRRLLLAAVTIYIAMLILPLVSYVTKTALLGLIPAILFIYIVQQAFKLIKSNPIITDSEMPVS
jgi:hypothetical protein